MTEIDVMSRREAITRAALLLGGTLAASTLAAAGRVTWAATPGWAPRTLTARQLETVATIAEHIIPATDTPGARAAGVHRLVDVLLTEYYGATERDRFLGGLDGLDVRATRAHGVPFLDCSSRDQMRLLEALDAEAYPPQEVLAKAEPQTSEIQKMRDSLPRAGSTSTSSTAQPPSASVDGATATARRELSSGWFFRRLKELTVLGYYTSQIGATKELHVSPMGPFQGDIPYRRVGRSWA